MRWINSFFLITCAAGALVGCASSSEKILPDNARTIDQIYSEFAGSDNAQKLEYRSRELKMRDAQYAGKEPEGDHYATGFPPQPERIAHLYPTLPNPELFMYVFPHPVGESGAPIPGYYTRFTMYEKNHYTLPGESVEAIRRNETVRRMTQMAIREEIAREEEIKREQALRKKRLRPKKID